MSYQIARDGEQIGIYSEEELVDAVERGVILTTDLAWTDGMDDWEPVETLIEVEEMEEDDQPREDPVSAPASGPSAVSSQPPVTSGAAPLIRPLGQPNATSHYAPPATAPPTPVVVPVRYGVPPPQMVRGSPYASIPYGHYGPAGSAIASLVMGILSLALLVLTGIPAIILGHVARGKIRRSGGAFSGHGMAVAGMVLGYVTTTLTLLALIIRVALPSMWHSIAG